MPKGRKRVPKEPISFHFVLCLNSLNNKCTNNGVLLKKITTTCKQTRKQKDGEGKQGRNEGDAPQEAGDRKRARGGQRTRMDAGRASEREREGKNKDPEVC